MKGLFIVPSDYEALVRKGVAHNISERDENGFLEETITVHPFASQKQTLFLSPSARLDEFTLPTTETWRPLSWLRLAWHLLVVIRHCCKLTKTNNIDFIRSQDPYYCGFIGFITSKLCGRPFCTSLHCDYDLMYELDPEGGAPRLFGSRPLAQKLEKGLLRRADLVLCISHYIAAYARRHGARAECLRLFRHIVPIPKTGQAPPSSCPSPARPIIAIVSRLSSQKFIHDALDIAIALRSRDIAFEMRLAGDGDQKETLERRIQENGLENCVTLLGFIDGQAVRDLYQRSTIYLSLLSGASLIEACANGVCPVAYDTEWQAELVQNGRTGFLVPSRDIQATATAIERLLSKPDECHRLADAANEIVRTEFSREVLLKQHQEVYSELVARYARLRRKIRSH